MDITLRILFRPEEKSLPWIFTNIGVDFDEKILPSIANEVLKGVVVRPGVSPSVCIYSTPRVKRVFLELSEGATERPRGSLNHVVPKAMHLSKDRAIERLDSKLLEVLTAMSETEDVLHAGNKCTPL